MEYMEHNTDSKIRLMSYNNFNLYHSFTLHVSFSLEKKKDDLEKHIVKKSITVMLNFVIIHRLLCISFVHTQILNVGHRQHT